MDWCTRTATSALASGVNATSPSIPAVLRPTLRCVTCRTLTSVFDRLRSISFCRFRTFAQSCSCAALKIRCRSRRTCPSCARQSILSHSAGASCLRGWSSGPFASSRAAIASANTCPVIGVQLALRFQRLKPPGFNSSPAPRQRAFAPGHPARYPASYTQPPSGGAGHNRRAFLLPFGRRHSLPEASFPARGFRPPYGRPTTPPASSADPNGVSMFRTRETWLAQGALCTPGAAVSTRPVFVPAAACRISTASPCRPGLQPAPGRIIDEASARVHCHSPHTSLPLACDPGRNGILGLSPELRTQPGRTRQRTSGRGQAWTLPGLRLWHLPASFDVLTHSVRPHVATNG